MTLQRLLEVIIVKDLAIATSVGLLGYNLYVLREAVKKTLHRHMSESIEDSDSSPSSVQSETEVSESRESDDLLFGFQLETWCTF